ncbi:MAG: EamA family transporter [candidate division Zixibacteria bacterium]|nr:EamA family transporter [candidate division Zixibacteria bacterium]
MERWLLFSILVGIVGGTYTLFTKLAAGKIPDAVGGFWLEVAAILGIVSYLAVARQPVWGPEVTRPGLVYTIIGGLCVSLASVMNFTIYRHRGELSAAGPITLLGSLVVTAAIGVLFLGESFSLSKGFGLVLAIAAIWLLAR